MATVAAIIPSIPPRVELLQRALASVLAQTHPVDEIHVAVDHGREGAAVTRTRALRAASSEYVAFLDDDDQLYPQHVAELMACAQETGADVVWPWFDVEGGTDPFPPEFFGRQWNPAEPHQFPVTVLARREALLAVGGFLITGQDLVRMPGWTGQSGEDMLCWVRLSDAGARLVHLPIRSWRWHHDTPGGNTEGRPDRW